MNKLQRYLYKEGIIKINDNKLNQWSKTHAFDKLILAAEISIYDIRLKCIELLSPHIHQQEVKALFTRMITDNVEAVSEAAIKALEPITSSELLNRITDIRNARKELLKKQKKLKKSYATSYKDNSRSKPSDRLMDRLRSQQEMNNILY